MIADVENAADKVAEALGWKRVMGDSVAGAD